MFEFIPEYFRRKRREKFECRKQETVHSLIKYVFSPNTPYIYNCYPSFLQPLGLDVSNLLGIDLFFQDYPMAVDILGPEYLVPYEAAKPFVSREVWEKLQRQVSTKKQILSKYRCPYLILAYNDPVDVASINEKIKTLIGRYPK